MMINRLLLPSKDNIFQEWHVVYNFSVHWSVSKVGRDEGVLFRGGVGGCGEQTVALRASKAQPLLHFVPLARTQESRKRLAGPQNHFIYGEQMRLLHWTRLILDQFFLSLFSLSIPTNSMHVTFGCVT